MNYKRLELKLRKIVEKRLTEGFNVMPYSRWDRHKQMASYFDSPTNCCALMAADPDCRNRLDGADALGLSYCSEAADIEAGFEDWNDGDHTVRDPELYAIGARIRRDYCEWQS